MRLYVTLLEMFSSTYWGGGGGGTTKKLNQKPTNQTTLKCLHLVLCSIADIACCIVNNISFYMETRKLNDLLLSTLGTESTCIC